jgi:DNA-binding Lrp family transcriptional regulator
MNRLDGLDAEILNIVQEAVPLVERPFAEIAGRLGATERDVIDRLVHLRNEVRVIRQISAIFDTKALGYRSTLVAARYSPDGVDQAAAIVSGHPGVSHNYLRNHAYNLWYTLAVPPNSRLGLDRTIERLDELSGAAATRKMETIKLFKIGVRLDVTGGREATSRSAGAAVAYDEEDQREAQSHPLTDADIRAIRVLQLDLPLMPTPFDVLASQAGFATADLLAIARRLLERKQMRRFAAVLRHREAGFAHNCMGVWDVPDERTDEVGAIMAGFDAVSHCYLRPRYEDWPYNIFTMVHGRTQQECNAVLDAIAEATGITGRAALWSTREYKKTRVSYFTREIEQWEARFA